jgi:protein-tyrosine phosphatase
VSAVTRVLVVCLGNICRSPTGEAALVEAAAAAGIELEVASAGTGDWHVGHPPDPRMRAAAQRAGLDLRGTAAQVDAAMLGAADLVLAMDRQNLADLQRIARAAGVDVPMRLFRDHDPDADGRHDVPDPYHGGPEGFDEVVDICRRTAAALVAELAGPATR